MASDAVFLRRAQITAQVRAAMPGAEGSLEFEFWCSALDDAHAADVQLVSAVIRFLADKHQIAVDRKRDIRILARSIVEPAAIHALGRFYRPGLISLAFSDPAHAGNLFLSLRASLWRWGDEWNSETRQFFGQSSQRDINEAIDLYGPPPTCTIIRSTELAEVVISYCCNYRVRRTSKVTSRNSEKNYASTDIVRTRDTAEGRQFCLLCPSPSERFVFVHQHAAAYTALGAVVLASIRNADGLSTDSYKAFSSDYCASHSIIGEERSKRNRGRRESDRKLLAAYKRECKCYKARLRDLGLCDPHSGSIRRKIAWLRVKPSAIRDHQKHLTDIRSHRKHAQHLVNETFGVLPGVDLSALTITDSMVSIEVNMSGRLVTTNHRDAVCLHSDSSDNWTHWSQAFCDAQTKLQRLIHEEFCWRRHVAPSAIFDALGLEVFVEHALIRFVFESPDLIDAAGARTKKTRLKRRSAKNTAS